MSDHVSDEQRHSDGKPFWEVSELLKTQTILPASPEESHIHLLVKKHPVHTPVTTE